jgi:hypothetical protein
MDLAIVLPLVLAAIVALAIVAFVRVASAALHRTRGASRSGLEIAQASERLERILADVTPHLAPATFDSADAAEMGRAAEATEREVRGLIDATRRLGPASQPLPDRERLLAAATRAAAALAVVVDAARSGARTEPPRMRERAFKRAYLDLVHAREEAATLSKSGTTGNGPAR